MIEISNQRLRNLTTGWLHTSILHIYEDLEIIYGEKGFMTHQLPFLCDQIKPFLKKQLPDQRFWNNAYDPNHTGYSNIAILTDKEKEDIIKS